MVVASTFVVIGTIVEFVTAVNTTTSVRLRSHNGGTAMTIIINSAGLLAGGFPHQMLRLPAPSYFNPPVVPGPEHAICVRGPDEGVGTVILAPVLKLHDHTLPHVLALVI